MKVTVLGSGNVTSARLSPSYLIDGQILFDVSHGAVKRLRSLGINPTRIDNVVISHFHADHYFDIVFFLLAQLKEKETDTRLTIYGAKGGKEKIAALFSLAYPDLKERFDALSYDYVDADTFRVDGYTVTRFPAVHGAMTGCYSYLLDDGKTKVAFSGDTMLTDTVRYLARVAEHFICECSVLKANKSHIDVAGIEMLANDYPNCHFYTTHMSDAVKATLEAKPLSNLTVLEDLKELTL